MRSYILVSLPEISGTDEQRFLVNFPALGPLLIFIDTNLRTSEATLIYQLVINLPYPDQ